MGIIYMYTSPSGKSYIGQTNNEKRRKREHRLMIGFKSAFHDAILKYGFDNFKYFVLHKDIYSKEELNRLEAIEIESRNTIVPNGYNLVSGGTEGRKASSATRVKSSESKKGRVNSPEARAKISAALKGVPKSKDHAMKVGLSNRGKKRSEESLKKIRESRSRIQCYCIEQGQYYNSITEASKKNGISPGCIALTLDNKRPTAGGMHWIASNLVSDMHIRKILNKKYRNDIIRMAVICVETGIVYKSITQADKDTGCGRGNISRCCKNNAYTTPLEGGRVHWRYADV